MLNCSPQLDYCEEHTDRALDFYCKSCYKFVCPECACHTMSASISMHNACRTQQTHTVEAADSVCETERIKLKEVNKELQLTLNQWRF